METEHTASDVVLARLPSGREIRTRVHRYEGHADGPTVYLQAAQHGIELNGPAVLRRIHRFLLDATISGTVVSVPVANPITFDHRTYMAPSALDAKNSNMNRAWPGDRDGTIQERMVAVLWDYVADADAVVDLHTGMPEMLEHVVFMAGNDLSRELARRFGIELLLAEEMDDEADSEWSQREFHAKLRNTATREGIPAITPELGNSRQIRHGAVETGVTGVRNVLAYMDVLEEEPAPPGEHVIAHNHVGRVSVDHSGLFEVDPAVGIGEDVSEGDRLGIVYDPRSFETLQTVRADREGVLYSLRRESTVVAGETVASVAIRA